MKWINTKAELPSIGKPVLIKTGSTVQHVTYTLDGDEEDTIYWFEPYFFQHEDEFKIQISKVTEWIYMEDVT